MERTIQNIDMLYEMPMPEWERQVRIKANKDHAVSTLKKWMREQERKNAQVCVHV